MSDDSSTNQDDEVQERLRREPAATDAHMREAQRRLMLEGEQAREKFEATQASIGGNVGARCCARATDVGRSRAGAAPR